MANLVSFGSINIDFQMRVDETEQRETLRARDFSGMAGGKAANRAYLARKLGHDVRLIGMVGDDDFARDALPPLGSIGVDVSAVGIAQGMSTAVSFIVVPPDGKKRITLAGNAKEAWSAAQRDAAVRALDSAPRDSIVSADAEIDADACAALLAAASRRRLRIVFDPSPPDHALGEAIRRQWPALHVLAPNVEEASKLIRVSTRSEGDALRAARRLCESGIALVCIKLDNGGCAAVAQGRAFVVRVPKIEPVDTTGAGDAFTGALSVALAENQPPEAALCFATAAANITVTRWGSQSTAPDRYEIDAQVLDMRNARVLRTLVLRADDATTLIEEVRYTSFANCSTFVIMWRVTACDWSGELEVADGIDGAVRNAIIERVRRFGGRHIGSVVHRDGPEGMLLLEAKLTGASVDIALATRTRIDGQPRIQIGAGHTWTESEACFRSSRVRVEKGVPVVITKTASVHTSRDPLAPNPADAALATLSRCGGADAMYQAHRRAWLAAWRSARVICADKPLSRALNLRGFKVAQTVTAHSAIEDLGVSARGWQEGYHGHIFWDDLFVLPTAGRTQPDHALGPLMYRYRRLNAARLAARDAGHEGAMYPWRSAATGEEETPRYQFNPLDGHWLRDDTRLERHVGASVAWNAWGYYRASGDQEFLRARGVEMIVEIARFWASAARFDATRGRYVIRGVIGPDEYHNEYPGVALPGLDNNAYTNVMAMWTLRSAGYALARLSKADHAALVYHRAAA
ncbi:PfkB family carbohydrate kinase [Caballeronia sp. S22]|uniref:PfkB family carbohydrate kinase n=1 Tax=Caballeronia sp. S22 TaxID=3137182 RepID=UPI003530CC68